MRIKIPEKEGWTGLTMGEIKISELDYNRVFITFEGLSCGFSKEGRYYIELLEDELIRILRDSYSVDELKNLVKRIELRIRRWNEYHCIKSGKTYFCSECSDTTCFIYEYRQKQLKESENEEI